MFKDEARLLKKENDDIARWLPEEDEDIIDKIMESLGIFRVNSFDAQVIRRDLIGMAEEARLRSSNMKEVIGDDIKLFTYDLIKNSRGSSKLEIILLYLKSISGIVLLSLGFFGTINLTQFSWDVSLLGLFSLVNYITYFFLISKLVRPLLNMEGWHRFGFYWSAYVGISTYSYAIIFGSLGTAMNENFKVFINKGYVLLVAGLIYLVSEYFYRKNIKNLAQDRSNYYEDLTD
ncbi:hypothetical protein [Tissierella sp. Yu-01]|uniref:hypothetical protein n=1 Tax=Tissierella sp. Yu-01 TaxID=3035694 RepID=UPI00240E6632|nr:hypothetical protein [Tissierella sp. Yu-01]WFA09939.1 hypothetical protein P3962_05150 [Tissierella sp. Yu-01]